ncbi:MAG: hypothetical protein ABGZ19_07650 [Verrucomicrobiales bacterium]
MNNFIFRFFFYFFR